MTYQKIQKEKRERREELEDFKHNQPKDQDIETNPIIIES